MLNAWFISDIHLKNRNERSSVILLRFLHSLLSGERPCSHLFLMGDIFDFWVGGDTFYQNRHQEVVDAIVALKKKNVGVIYFEGNHDVHVKQFWQSVGVSVFVDPEYFQLGPWTVRLEHGDLMNPADLKYLKYREFIRRDSVKNLALQIPAKFFDMIGRRSSAKSRKRSMYATDYETLRVVIRDYSEKAHQEKKYDYLIAGHMHFVDEYQIPNSTSMAINLGTWLEQPRAMLLTDKGHVWLEL